MELEEKIRRTRQQRGLTQEALAERLEVSRQAVAKWEHGGARPSTENLIALSRVLEVPLEELTGAAPAPRSRLPRLLALSALGVVVVTLWVYLRRREG